MLKNLRWASLLCLLVFTLSACETMDGAGRDIENAGQGIQKSAE